MIDYPYHQRICSENLPILERYDQSHVAVKALQTHAEACDYCVGKEIAWPNLNNRPIDHLWLSAIRRKHQNFSGIAYQFISYDLILDGWIDQVSRPTRNEIIHIKKNDPLFQSLLNECEESAVKERNMDIIPLIHKAREFALVYNKAIIQRFTEIGMKL